jgi:signal transduction histidine kinase
LAVEVLERIRRSIQSASAQMPEPVARILQQTAPSPRPPAVEDTWSRLAELLGLDRGYVRRVCKSYPDWCSWLYSMIMGTPVPVPSTTPSADVLTLIEQTVKRGLAQRIDLKELAKAVGEYVESIVKELRRPGTEVRQRIEEVLRLIRDIHGSRAQPVIEEEVFKRLRNIVQESIARDIAKVVARASVELPPAQAIEKLEQLTTAVRRMQAEVKQSPPALRQGVQSPEQAKPLRPSATVKQV